MYRGTIALLILAAPLALAQQPPGNDPVWQFWARGNGQLFENFFQSPDDGENVGALQGELGASLGLTRGVRLYGSASYLHFPDEAIEGSPGVRVGVRGDRRPHGFEVYAERLDNRPSFDLDGFQGADISRLSGEYSYRLLEDWQVSVDGDFEQQSFDETPERDNDFPQLGAALRWRGSRAFSPEIGFRRGEREVEDALQSYDQNEKYLQIRSQTTERLYLSVRLRDRRRDYQNIAREDERRQIAVGADYTLYPDVILNLYGAREWVDTTVPERDFTSGLWIAGLTYRF